MAGLLALWIVYIFLFANSLFWYGWKGPYRLINHIAYIGIDASESSDIHPLREFVESILFLAVVTAALAFIGRKLWIRLATEIGHLFKKPDS